MDSLSAYIRRDQPTECPRSLRFNLMKRGVGVGVGMWKRKVYIVTSDS